MTAGRKNNNSRCLDWGTPHKYANAVYEVLTDVKLDPCSNVASIIRAEVKYSLPERDGLVESWDFDTIFVNPPYGRDYERKTTIKDWLRRCYQSSVSHGSEVLALVPVSPNTSHWKEYVWGKATSIAFLYDTRLKFLEDGKDVGKGAPMACCMIYYGSKNQAKFHEVFGQHGFVVDIEK